MGSTVVINTAATVTAVMDNMLPERATEILDTAGDTTHTDMTNGTPATMAKMMIAREQAPVTDPRKLHRLLLWERVSPDYSRRVCQARASPRCVSASGFRC